MHDIADYEARGIPAVLVASGEFMKAAAKQSEALGLPDIASRAVYVPHPIQDATDKEMRAKARAAVDALLEALTS